MPQRGRRAYADRAAGMALVDWPVVRSLVWGRTMWEMPLDRKAGTRSARLAEATS